MWNTFSLDGTKLKAKCSDKDDSTDLVDYVSVSEDGNLVGMQSVQKSFTGTGCSVSNSNEGVLKCGDGDKPNQTRALTFFPTPEIERNWAVLHQQIKPHLL